MLSDALLLMVVLSFFLLQMIIPGWGCRQLKETPIQTISTEITLMYVFLKLSVNPHDIPTHATLCMCCKMDMCWLNAEAKHSCCLGTIELNSDHGLPSLLNAASLLVNFSVMFSATLCLHGQENAISITCQQLNVIQYFKNLFAY